MCHISSSLASSIITNHDHPPSLDEPNSLEMLQKRAQEVLDSASQGLLAGNLADELAFRKDKMSGYDSKGNRTEPFFKHRCRYCGKVFGSDSALQIHIRSHTGERPFKCNVCGSRFTTKGNLKVHFQRHTSKFPHIQMNPNPIPEHLDKYHPPLMAQMSPGHSQSPVPQMSSHQQMPVSVPMQFGQPPAFPGLPMFRPQMDLLKPLGQLPLFGFGHPSQQEQDGPADLSKPSTMASPSSSPPLNKRAVIKREVNDSRSPSREREFHARSPPMMRDRSPSEERTLNLSTTRSKVEDTDEEDKVDEEALRIENERIERRQQEILRQLEIENERIRAMEYERHRELERLIREREAEREKEMERRSRNRVTTPPHRSRSRSKSNENLDRRKASINYDECSMESKYSDMRDQDEPENLSAKAPTRSPHSSASSQHSTPNFSSASKRLLQPKDPSIYSALMPRPNSNDNSWESLIEVTKTSETSKLQQLVDNIENKLTDPNQCVVCHRVLSCKSALQMHYRTHTGERPFRCRICGRAFTTKGNLKTHMGVHRMKPPMRTLHQCPVCHKKYSNALVLQQHIRTHTGEPTDLTAEQISAAEIRDFPSLSPGSFGMGMNPFGFPLTGFPPGMGSGSSQGDCDDMMDDDDEFDEDNNSSIGDQGSMTDSMTGHLNFGLENQVRTITSMASQLSASGLNKSQENLSRAQSASSHRMSNGEKGSSPSSPAGSRNHLSPTHSDNSMGALDLTPKSSMASQASPPIMHSAPPMSMFPNFPMLPHGPIGASTPMMNSALNSLAQSVLPASPFNPLGISGKCVCIILRNSTLLHLSVKCFVMKVGFC